MSEYFLFRKSFLHLIRNLKKRFHNDNTMNKQTTEWMNESRLMYEIVRLKLHSYTHIHVQTKNMHNVHNRDTH